MRMLRLLSFIAFPILAAPAWGSFGAAPALPPESIGNSFLSMNWSFLGNGGVELIYLGNDGSYEELSNGIYDGSGLPPKYQPSQTGSYTYVPSGGDPDAATLTLTAASGSTEFILEFTGDTFGFPSSPGVGSFSFLLVTPNTFLTNVSNRVTLRPSDTAVTGFVIEGTESRLVLIRAVGPGLAQFGVKAVSANPALGLYSAAGTDLIASGQDWGSVTGYDARAMAWVFGIAGAFPLLSGSNDNAYFGILKPGAYTVQTSDPSTPATGASALTEVYILPYSG
jgi:hypothetical protein